MNNKSNQILVGVILFLVGFYCLFQRSSAVDVGAMFMAALGFAFILLYQTKKKGWSLLLGAYLMYYGLSDVARAFIYHWNIGGMVELVLDNFFSGMFFAILGIVFLTLFYDKNKNGLLIPGSLLIGWGIHVFVANTFVFLGNGAFLVVMGLCFYYIYWAGKYFLGRWPLYTAVLLLFGGLFRLR